jgi:hypothetical protein
VPRSQLRPDRSRRRDRGPAGGRHARVAISVVLGAVQPRCVGELGAVSWTCTTFAAELPPVMSADAAVPATAAPALAVATAVKAAMVMLGRKRVG